MDTPDTLINQLITEGALNVTVLNNVSNIKPFTIPINITYIQPESVKHKAISAKSSNNVQNVQNAQNTNDSVILGLLNYIQHEKKQILCSIIIILQIVRIF